MPISMQRVGDWDKLAKILDRAPTKVIAVSKLVIQQEAEFLRTEIIKNLDSGGKRAGKPFRANRPSTRRAKGSNKPLIDTGAMRQSIQVLKRGKSTFVGVNRKVKGKQRRSKGGQFAKGFNMVDLAEIHELGKVITIKVTAAMLRFLHAKFAREGGGGGGKGRLTLGGVLVIRIPPRPFIGPVVEKHYGNKVTMTNRFLKRFTILMGGDFGSV